MFTNTKQQPPKAVPGIIAISDGGILQMKLCWKVPGDVDRLVHALRDGGITMPVAIFEKAIDLGFEGLLLVTRTGRITEEGASEDPSDPKEQDHIRKDFHKDGSNPFGRGTQLFMDMTGEFEAARKAESGKAKKR